MEAELVEYEHGLRGFVRVAANKSAILQSLPEDLAAFLAQHRWSHRSREGISPSIIEAVANNAADIGIFGANIPAPDLQTFLYREDEMVAVMPPRHRLASQASVRFADMVEYDFVCLERQLDRDALRSRRRRARRQLKLRVRVSGFDAQFRLIETGLGIGLVRSRWRSGGRNSAESSAGRSTSRGRGGRSISACATSAPCPWPRACSSSVWPAPPGGSHRRTR